MLRRTSKKVKKVVEKLLLPAVVRLSRDFWNDCRNGTREDKLKFVLRQLAAMTACCRITTLELPDCEMVGQDAEILAGVLVQRPPLLHLDLSWNEIGQLGLGYLSGLLQCTALTRLNLNYTRSAEGGAERLAAVLVQCPALVHLDLKGNDIIGKALRLLPECWAGAQR